MRITKNSCLGILNPITLHRNCKVCGSFDAYRFSYDINGLLDIDIYVPSIEEQKQLTINNAPGELSDKEIQASRRKLAKLKTHPKEDEKIVELIMRAESIYENYYLLVI